jgi:hypothetical protein
MKEAAMEKCRELHSVRAFDLRRNIKENRRRLRFIVFLFSRKLGKEFRIKLNRYYSINTYAKFKIICSN